MCERKAGDMYYLQYPNPTASTFFSSSNNNLRPLLAWREQAY